MLLMQPTPLLQSAGTEQQLAPEHLHVLPFFT
jgi:hypothetical protein